VSVAYDPVLSEADPVLRRHGRAYVVVDSLTNIKAYARKRMAEKTFMKKTCGWECREYEGKIELTAWDLRIRIVKYMVCRRGGRYRVVGFMEVEKKPEQVAEIADMIQRLVI